jgi:hypothetical protein
MSTAIDEKKMWSKRRPGKALTGFEGAAGCKVMVDIVAPELNLLLAGDTRGSWKYCMPRQDGCSYRKYFVPRVAWRSGCGITPCEPGKKDQHQTVKEERDNHGSGIAEAEIFEEKFQGTDGDSSVGNPPEFDAMPARAEKAQSEGEGAVHDGADDGETRGVELEAAGGCSGDGYDDERSCGETCQDCRSDPQQATLGLILGVMRSDEVADQRRQSDQGEAPVGGCGDGSSHGVPGVHRKRRNCGGGD